MASTREWTNQDLVDGAAERGYSLDERVIVDWTQKGLLDQPQRRGTGRGSAAGVRPESQAELLWALLKHRHTVRKLTTLANIPVFVWLGWGDRHVPIRQVRRAMHTYCEANVSAPGTRARESALEHLRKLGLENTPKRVRDELTAVITAMSATPLASIDPFVDRFHKALMATVAPEGTSFDVPYVENVIWLIDARLRAAVAFRERTDEHVYPDRFLEQLQLVYRQTAIELEATLRRTPQEFLQAKGNNACLDLLTMIGLDLDLSPHRPVAR